MIGTIVQESALLLDCAVISVRRADYDALGDRWGLAQQHVFWQLPNVQPLSPAMTFIELNGQNLVAEVYRLGHARWVDDIRRHPDGLRHINAHKLGLKAAAFFPLATSGEVIGTLALYRNSTKTFTDTDLAYGQALADQLATVLATDQLLQTVRRERELRQAWHTERDALLPTLAVPDQLRALAERIVGFTRTQLGAEVANLFLDKDAVLVPIAIAGVELDGFADEHYRKGEGVTGQVLAIPAGARYGQPVLDNHVDENPHTVAINLQRYKRQLPSGIARHLIAVPLNGKERTLGVLRVVNHLQVDGALDARGFAKQDLEQMLTIASVVAADLEDALQRESQARVLAEREYMLEFARDITALQSSEAVLSRSLQRAVSLLNAEAGYVVLPDKRGQGWVFSITVGERAQAVCGFKLAAETRRNWRWRWANGHKPCAGSS